MTAFQFVKPGRSALKLNKGQMRLKDPVFNDTGFPVFIRTDQRIVFHRKIGWFQDRILAFGSAFQDLDWVRVFQDKDVFFQVRV
jgi:hypothetical protein